MCQLPLSVRTRDLRSALDVSEPFATTYHVGSLCRRMHTTDRQPFVLSDFVSAIQAVVNKLPCLSPRLRSANAQQSVRQLVDLSLSRKVSIEHQVGGAATH